MANRAQQATANRVARELNLDWWPGATLEHDHGSIVLGRNSQGLLRIQINEDGTLEKEVKVSRLVVNTVEYIGARIKAEREQCT